MIIWEWKDIKGNFSGLAGRINLVYWLWKTKQPKYTFSSIIYFVKLSANPQIWEHSYVILAIKMFLKPFKNFCVAGSYKIAWKSTFVIFNSSSLHYQVKPIFVPFHHETITWSFVLWFYGFPQSDWNND